MGHHFSSTNRLFLFVGIYSRCSQFQWIQMDVAVCVQSNGCFSLACASPARVHKTPPPTAPNMLEHGYIQYALCAWYLFPLTFVVTNCRTIYLVLGCERIDWSTVSMRVWFIYTFCSNLVNILLHISKAPATHFLIARDNSKVFRLLGGDRMRSIWCLSQCLWEIRQRDFRWGRQFFGNASAIKFQANRRICLEKSDATASHLDPKYAFARSKLRNAQNMATVMPTNV